MDEFDLWDIWYAERMLREIEREFFERWHCTCRDYDAWLVQHDQEVWQRETLHQFWLERNNYGKCLMPR